MNPVCFINKFILALAMFFVWAGLLSSCSDRKDVVGLSTLLEEMTTVEEVAMYPAIPYRSLSVSGRAEGVLFDQKGPGVITRLRLSGSDQGVLRFYFDGASVAEITLQAGNLALPGMEEEGAFTADGSVLYLPVPYNERCRITFEEGAGEGAASSGYYQINYRMYAANVNVETFSGQRLSREKKHIAGVSRRLMEADSTADGEELHGEAWLEWGDPLVVNLPKGENAIYRLEAQVTMPGSGGDYAQGMRDVIFQGLFDGKLTVKAPLSDFSGGGMGAPYVKSRYLSADGRGDVVSRWLMPYREKASLAFINEGKARVHVRYSVLVSPLAWDEERTLYFHASWKEQTGVAFSGEERTWNFAVMSGGKGVYKGDALSVYNYGGARYDAAGVEIRVDDEDEPSYTETTVWDYYNSRLPADIFHTPFGGLPRVGAKGYNSMLRIRMLDDIPFAGRLSIDLRLPDEKEGRADYAVTTFWYGDKKARPETISRPEIWGRTLPRASLE
jgi:hypothetical protein